jgi:hypothetical protein
MLTSTVVAIFTGLPSRLRRVIRVEAAITRSPLPVG